MAEGNLHHLTGHDPPADGDSRSNRSQETNDFGKTIAERELILNDLAIVEPLLRAGSTHELDASLPLDEVVDALVAISHTL